MALWSRPEPPGTEPAEPGEFEGRTAEEALDRARRALGPSTELRCWKTRRGGIGGFFATEVFVASVNPPAGALAAQSKGRRRRANPAKDDAGSGLIDTIGAPGGGGDRVVGAGGPHVITPAGTSGPAPSDATPPAEPPATVQGPPGDEAPPVVTYERPSRTAGDAKAGDAKAGDDRAGDDRAGDDRAGDARAGDDRAGDDRAGDMADSLAALADGTTDQLSLDFDSIPSHSFDEVLAEAEAAVAGVTAWSDRPGPSVQMVVAPPDDGAEAGDRSSARVAPVDVTDGATPPEDPGVTPSAAPEGAPEDAAEQVAAPDATDTVRNAATAPAERRRRTRAKSPATPRTPRRPTAPATAPPTGVAPAPPPAPQPIPDLFERLRSLGVPDAHLPDPDRLTLDAVARSMDGLPEAPPLPIAPGSVVAVVGTAAALARTTRLLAGAAPFRHGPRPDPARRVWSPEDRTGPDRPLDDVLQEGDPLEVAGRVARRRLDGRPSLVAVEVVPGHPMRSHDRLVITSVQPDYVLGAIDASAKRADVVQWRDDLGVVDAVALWGLDGTVSPAELLGVLPIAFVDGVPGTPVTWTLHLLHRAAEGGG